MQGNFNPQMMNMNMNMNLNNMNNMAPIHPTDDAGEQDMMTEILNISKIKEGFYIGDKISEIRNTIDSVKNSGFVVDSEEYDLEDSYQINIIIKKPQD